MAGRSVSLNRRPILPTSERGPVAVTKRVPLPIVTRVPANASLRRLDRGKASPGKGSECFATGADSPVKSDSSTEKAPARIRPSAGMRSPASSRTTSPGTRLSLSRSRTLPPRRTRALGAVRPWIEAISRSAW
ncbi:hypothetical protein D3C86_1293440 [compost metagenome]